MAQAKTARRARGRGDIATLETKGIGGLETKDGAAGDTGPTGVELKAAMDLAARLTEQVNELTAKIETKSGKDGLADETANKAIRDLHDQLNALQTKLKAKESADERKSLEDRLAALETKSQRPAREGRSSMDGDGGDGQEQKNDRDGIALEHKSAFLSYVRTGDKGAMRDFAEAFELKDMSSLSDPNGGFFVPEEIDREINRILTETGGFRSLARVRSISGQQYKKRTSVKGVDAGWVGEKDDRPRTGTPQYEEIDIGTGEIYARPAITQTLLEDANVDLEAELAMEVALAFELLENAAFLNGDGQKGKPKGLLTYSMVANASAKSWGQFGFIASGATTGISGTTGGDKLEKLIDLQHALKTPYRRGASWIMNDATMAFLRKFKDADGLPILATVTATGVTQLLGSPINIVHEMPDIASSAIAIGYGDWARTYTIVDRLGSTTDRFYDSNTAPYVEFYTRKRLGGGVEFFEAAKFMKFAA